MSKDFRGLGVRNICVMRWSEEKSKHEGCCAMKWGRMRIAARRLARLGALPRIGSPLLDVLENFVYLWHEPLLFIVWQEVPESVFFLTFQQCKVLASFTIAVCAFLNLQRKDASSNLCKENNSLLASARVMSSVLPETCLQSSLSSFGCSPSALSALLAESL